MRTSSLGALLLGLILGLGGLLLCQPRHQPLAMLLCLIGAAALLARAVGLPPRAPLAPTPGRQAPPWAPRLALAGAVAGSLLLLAALHLFRGSAAVQGRAWSLYVLAVAVVGMSVSPWRGTLAEPDLRPTRRELLCLVIVLALAAAPRLYRLGTLPSGVWIDEAEYGVQATHILSDPAYRPVFVGGRPQMPALMFYALALSIRLLDPTVFAVRFVAAAGGVLAVACTWFLGRELFGRRVGLLAAALLAFNRWHLDFSRFGIPQIWNTVFAPLVLALFVRSLRRRSPRAAIGAGMALGIGLQLYYAVAVLVVLLIVYTGHRLFSARAGKLVVATLLALTLLGGAFVYAPVAQFALRQGDEFTKRYRTVSVLPWGSPGQLIRFLSTASPRRDLALDELAGSLVKHLRMFHLEGDNNGRHNLPGAPMLDPVTGLLFAIGLFWCLARIREPELGLLAAWFVLMLAPGVLSLAFEAPQGARALGVTPVIALLAALPLAQVSRAIAGWVGGERGRALGLSVAAICVALVAANSLWTYFARQVWDPAVWAAFSTQETKVARVARDEGKGTDLYVRDGLRFAEVEQFIIGHPLQARRFQRDANLPLPSRGRPAIVFFEGHERETMDLIRRFYPRSAFEPFAPPSPDGAHLDPIMWIARVPRADIDALGGWSLEYRSGTRPPIRETALTSAWTWSRAPLPPPFVAHLTGCLRVAQDGSYRMILHSTSPAEMRLDGGMVLGGERREAPVMLARGGHEVALEVSVGRSDATTALRWDGPGTGGEVPIPADQMYAPGAALGGLLGSYFPSPAWTGEPALRRIDPQVALYFHILPLQRPFSVSWSGSIHAPATGEYEFATTAVDASFVSIGGRQVIANRTQNERVAARVFLTQGWHELEVRYQAVTNYSQIYLYWTPPGEKEVLVPAAVLRPPGPGGEARAATRGLDRGERRH